LVNAGFGGARASSLLAVHVNSIKHNIRQTTDRPGISPLHVMGIFHAANGSYYLYEKHAVVKDAAEAELGYEWRPYEDFLDPVLLPKYIPSPAVGYVMPLSVYTENMIWGATTGLGTLATGSTRQRCRQVGKSAEHTFCEAGLALSLCI
jgi:hypothetical protein